MILFSIITICKENLNELKLTHDSIRSQTNTNFEWIVIDGDSKDGTRDWLTRNKLVTSWLSEPDDGIYDAMNKGIKLANGRYLIFMNSADEFASKNVLKNIESEIGREQVDPILVYGDSWDIDESGKKYYRKAKKYNQIKYGMITQHQAMFFNHKLDNQISYKNEFKLSADYAMICSIIRDKKSHSILKVDYPICKFKMGGVNEQKRFKALKEDFQIRKNILGFNIVEVSLLYLLHYIHTVVKHTFDNARFIKHKPVK